MNDSFKARILAELDLSKIPNDIKKIEKQEVTLRNITLDTSSLPKTIQGSLDKHKFQISLDGIKMNNIDSQMRKAGDASGQAFSKSMFNAAFKEYTRLQREIGSIELKITKLDSEKNQSQIAELNNQLVKLKNELQEVDRAFADGFSDAQIQTILNSYDTLGRKVSETKAKIEDSHQAIAKRVQLGIDTGEFQAKVNAIERDFDKLGDSASGVLPDLEKLKTALSTMKTSTDMDEVVAAYKEYSSLLPKISNQTKDLLAAQKQLTAEQKRSAKEQENLTKAATLSNKMEAWLNSNTEAAKRYGSEIRRLQDTLSEDIDGSAYKDVALRFGEIQSEAKAAGLTVKSFGSSVKDFIKQVTDLGGAVSIFYKVVQMLKAMYGEVVNIDTAMTNLYKVTDASAGKYVSFLSSSEEKAKKLGRTVSSLVEQSASWAKLGYNIDEASSLSQLSSIYANVAEVDDATAVSDMVTAMKAFNIETSNAVTIVDSLNELGNNFATSAGDLGTGLAKSASALNNAGVDFYQTVAMLTGGAEITQNANEFGSFLKIGSMRIRGMKGELEALGEEVDESVDSISKVQTQILNLTHGKVNIFDDTGEFRNYYDIMKDIAAIYDDLSSTDRADLTEILFGKQRGNQGAALLQAFQSGQIEKAYQTAIDSAGSAYKEQLRWMESLEAKTNQFKAAWQELSYAFLDSNFLKGAIDTGTELIEILTWLIDNVGALPVAIGTAFGALSGIKNKGRDRFIQFFPIREYARRGLTVRLNESIKEMV